MINSQYKNWEKTSDLYCNWLSHNNIKNFFLNNLFYQDLSFWWANNLVAKDNVVNNEWFKKLNKVFFHKKKFEFNLFLFIFIFFLKFFKNLLKDLFFLIVLKFFFKTRFNNLKQQIVFHSYEYNFLKKGNRYLDKNYLITPYKKFKKNNIFAINIVNKFLFISKIIFYKRVFKKINLPYVILDEHLSISEIFWIYFQSLKAFLKTLNFCINKDNKKIFYIHKKDCRNILLPLLLESFCGTTQEYLIRSQSKFNYLKKFKKKIFICYGEFNPGFLPSYHFVKKSNNKILIITIQHSYANENLMFFKNYRSQFVNKRKNFISPMPDKYFVMGNHYKDILKKYYPNEIKIIGALRYDEFYKKKLLKKKVKSSKFTILVCPTIGDEQTIIASLNKINLESYKIIVSPHPVIFDKTIDKFKRDLDKSFDYYKNLSSSEIITSADLVLCGFSSMSLDSLMLGIPAVRLIDEKYPFHFDLKDGIKYFTDSDSLKKYLSQRKKENNFYKIKSICKNIFYKLDNKSYERFWRSIPKKYL